MSRGPIVMPAAYSFSLPGGADRYPYRILIAEPIGPAPEAGFPVVYLLDAANAFGTMVDAIRTRSRRPDATGVGPAVIVGIDHGGGAGGGRDRRIRDFAAWPPAQEARATMPGAVEGGGAGEFLRFLERELKPVVETATVIDRRHQVLFGHSMGGLFTLWAFTQCEATFRAYVAVSPSIWWNPRALDEAIAGRQGVAGHDTIGVMVTVGEFEQCRAPWQPAGGQTDDAIRRRESRRMVDHVAAAAASVGRTGARVDWHEFKGEDHASVVPLSVARCLRFVLPPASLLI